MIDFGLSDKEADIYLICLKAGEATANRISSLSNFPRSTTYDILEKLKHQGFITTTIKDKKTFFIANNPNTILMHLDEAERRFLEDSANKKRKFNEILPKLENLQNKINAKPTAEVFEGIVSLSKVLDDISENADEILIIGSQENAVENIGYRVDRFKNKRKLRKIKTRQILDDTKETREAKIDKSAQFRFLDSLIDSKEATFIYNDIVVHLIISHEISAIRIKSKEYADSRKIIFEELWKNANK
mgnify:CR=1 FL=1